MPKFSSNSNWEFFEKLKDVGKKLTGSKPGDAPPSAKL